MTIVLQDAFMVYEVLGIVVAIVLGSAGVATWLVALARLVIGR